MVKSDGALKRAVECVNKTMSDCRYRLRNRAMLRNSTALSPIIENDTRWSGKYLMLERFNRIYDDLRKVAEDENSTVAMNLTSWFKANVQRYAKLIQQIDNVTRYLQTKNLTV